MPVSVFTVNKELKFTKHLNELMRNEQRGRVPPTRPREDIISCRAAVCACIRRFKGVAPRARSSSCPGYLWRLAQRLEPPLVLLNQQFRVARRGASCARPAVVFCEHCCFCKDC